MIPKKIGETNQCSKIRSSNKISRKGTGNSVRPWRTISRLARSISTVSGLGAAEGMVSVKGAGRILRAQTVRLAKEHNVTIPTEHIAASVKHLGAL